jgi:hypothetical protein
MNEAEMFADRNSPWSGRFVPIEKVIRAIQEAQRRDEEDERRLPVMRDDRDIVRRRRTARGTMVAAPR